MKLHVVLATPLRPDVADRYADSLTAWIIDAATPKDAVELVESANWSVVAVTNNYMSDSERNEVGVVGARWLNDARVIKRAVDIQIGDTGSWSP